MSLSSGGSRRGPRRSSSRTRKSPGSTPRSCATALRARYTSATAAAATERSSTARGSIARATSARQRHPDRRIAFSSSPTPFCGWRTRKPWPRRRRRFAARASPCSACAGRSRSSHRAPSRSSSSAKPASARSALRRKSIAQSRRTGPLVAVNCAAIPEALAEAELFGHTAGAFTGATQRSDGVLVAADKGTLFLDEIAELPLPLQPKLLRALATGEVAPGQGRVRTVDVRIVAATHGDVEGAVGRGGFRGDLLARLAGWTLRVPPLRERREDILGLARFFLQKGGASLSLSAGGAEALLLHDWRFNVRELEQVLAAAVIRASEGVIRAEHFPEPIARPVLARAATVPSDPPADPLAGAGPARRDPRQRRAPCASPGSFTGTSRRSRLTSERIGSRSTDGPRSSASTSIPPGRTRAANEASAKGAEREPRATPPPWPPSPQALSIHRISRGHSRSIERAKRSPPPGLPPNRGEEKTWRACLFAKFSAGAECGALRPLDLAQRSPPPDSGGGRVGGSRSRATRAPLFSAPTERCDECTVRAGKGAGGKGLRGRRR